MLLNGFVCFVVRAHHTVGGEGESSSSIKVIIKAYFDENYVTAFTIRMKNS